MSGDPFCFTHGQVPCSCSKYAAMVQPSYHAPSVPDYSEQIRSIGESLSKLVNLMETRSDRTLQGWKEIADYLGMSVSRAKRLGSSGRRDRMPVYSFHGRVYAKPTALDRWRTDSSVAVGVG